MRLLLLANKTKATSLLSHLHQERIYYDLLHSAAFISHAPFSKRIYNGVLIDQLLIDQSSSDDITTLELLKKVLPCRTIPSDTNLSQNMALATFFETCRHFPPRSVRQQIRVDLNLPVQVSTNVEFSNPQRTTTLNLSSNGCFLANPPNGSIGDKVWVELDELQGTSPLLGEIRWFSPGTDMSQPRGMGVKFLGASSDQVVQLEWLMRRGVNL